MGREASYGWRARFMNPDERGKVSVTKNMPSATGVVSDDVSCGAAPRDVMPSVDIVEKQETKA
ncbi:hypothetical protein CH63R_12732 [Colletotrichum higginsianum IMI 349063]|uniref:Uncharacterized protein n=1 Tax=Colletotrichum higginsianum (strain IMI 349063) TaxID=759273 RepID=A0A1B7XV19_COLHI|nr:hypothetical protein CH63R_12732 [Colletotrichum higginsianum IMI 349063]OBR03605.1 hypothetical protein CH63R_12732 [Colletotrichum higginsianum IMI 349063]GJD02049.1 hypothetical protein ColKHC_10874 [Colletotrichum higginsianum]